MTEVFSDASRASRGPADAEDRPGVSPAADELGLRSLFAEVSDGAEGAANLLDRMQELLQAVVAIGSQLDFADVPQWIVTTAAKIADAEYAALGIIDASGGRRLSQFITCGIDDDLQAEIGDFPRGHGVLGLLIDEPQAIKVADIGLHPASHGFPPHHPPMRTFLGVPLLVRGQVFGNLYLAEKHGGGEFTVADEQLVNALATAAGLAMQNARLYQQLKQRQRWLEASRDITTMLLAGSPAAEVFPHLIACVRDIAGADTAFLVLPAVDGTFRTDIADGFGAEDIRGMVFPSDSMSAHVMRGSHPVAVLDARLDSQVWQDVMDVAGAGPALFVPLGTDDLTVGTMVVTNRTNGSPFGHETVALIENFAGQAALALRLGAAARDREQLAILGDRDRIARDLHDLVIQRLFATGMSLDGALREMQPADAAHRVHRAVDDLDATIKEIRSTIFALQSPAPLAGEGLEEGIRHAANAAHSTLGFTPQVQIEGPVNLLVPPAVGEQLLAVLREALSNVARHAQATTVTVTVSASSDHARLVVRDDGIGIAKDGPRSGLANLARRATDLNGRFDLRAPDEGTGAVVEWSVPLPSMMAKV